MGGKRAKGAWPCASSRTVMPNDQMSASALYLRRGVPSSAGRHDGCPDILFSRYLVGAMLAHTQLPPNFGSRGARRPRLAEQVAPCALSWGQIAGLASPWGRCRVPKRLSGGAPLCLLHDLGRHPAGSADKGVAASHLLAPRPIALQRCRHAEVR